MNGTLQGSTLPFSLLASHWKSMGSQLRGRAARGDHLIQLKHPLESICKARREAAHHLQSIGFSYNAHACDHQGGLGKSFIVNMPSLMAVEKKNCVRWGWETRGSSSCQLIVITKIDWGCGVLFKARGHIRREHNVKWIGLCNVEESGRFLHFKF